VPADGRVMAGTLIAAAALGFATAVLIVVS